MNETPRFGQLYSGCHLDHLSRGEIKKIVDATSFIATEKSASVGMVKRAFDLTDTEYEIMVEIAMPLMRALSRGDQWKRLYTNHMKKLGHLIDKPHDHPMGERSVMSWADDPVVRLERLEREIMADYNEAFKSGKPLEHLLQMATTTAVTEEEYE